MLNYTVTQELLNIIEPFVSVHAISISTRNVDWRGKEYDSDLITIDDKNRIGFEVFDNEIIMFYFSEHHHFEDYSSVFDESEPDYIERAKTFLRDLFSCTITHQKTFKGKTLISEKYTFIHPNGTTECPAGVCLNSILIRFVPFLKTRTENQFWIFNKDKGSFEKV